MQQKTILTGCTGTCKGISSFDVFVLSLMTKMIEGNDYEKCGNFSCR